MDANNQTNDLDVSLERNKVNRYYFLNNKMIYLIKILQGFSPVKRLVFYADSKKSIQKLIGCQLV